MPSSDGVFRNRKADSLAFLSALASRTDGSMQVEVASRADGSMQGIFNRMPLASFAIGFQQVTRGTTKLH